MAQLGHNTLEALAQVACIMHYALYKLTYYVTHT